MLPDFSRNLTEKMLTYALGRGVEPYDRPVVQGITTRLAASGYGFRTLVNQVVESLPFQARRGEAVPSGQPGNKPAAAQRPVRDETLIKRFFHLMSSLVP
jgi:hypothetical protein